MNITDEFFDLTVNLEGGFSNRAADHGGATKYGITQNTLNGYNLICKLPSEDVKDISVDKAKEIYVKNYFSTVEECDNIEIHFNFVDICYNSGHKRYIQMKNDLGDNFMINDVYTWRTQYYNSLNQPKNINGWLNRLARIQQHFSNEGKI